MPLTFDLPDPAATKRFACALAPLLHAGDLLALFGDLGAGKTSFARALLHALPGPEGSDKESVPSPTFTLVQHYERDLGPVAHADLYRLENPGDADELGLEESAAQGLVLIEWPERLGQRLAPTALRLTFSFKGEGRQVTVEGAGAWAMRLQSLTPRFLESRS